MPLTHRECREQGLGQIGYSVRRLDRIGGLSLNYLHHLIRIILAWSHRLGWFGDGKSLHAHVAGPSGCFHCLTSPLPGSNNIAAQNANASAETLV
jgi:hypothetical protein